MKKTLLSMTAAMAVLGSIQLGATTYSDSLGDLFVGAGGGGILDISSVEVTNDASNLSFNISVNTASITTPDWGKYTIGFDTVPGGDTTSPAGNPWARNIRMSSGMDYWVGSWVDSGGNQELYSYSGTWSLPSLAAVTISGNTLSFSVPLSSLGLSVGSTFAFDVYTTGGGGGDTAVDALSNPGIAGANWSDPYDSGALVSVYTVVPEPTTLAFLVTCAGLVTLRLFRHRA